MWKDFFYYTRGEQRGIVVLLSLILIMFFINIFQSHFYTTKDLNKEKQQFLLRIDELNDSLNLVNKDSLFAFDPNTIVEDEMNALGFSELQKNSLIGYRKKIGKIYTKSDLLKVYGFDSITLIKYSNYIQIKQKKKESRIPVEQAAIKWINFNQISKNNLLDFGVDEFIADSIVEIVSKKYILKGLPSAQIKKYDGNKLIGWILANSKVRFNTSKPDNKAEVVHLELNSATKEDLIKLPGIGNVFADRILKFRGNLGGFVSVKQLKEVYRLSSDTYSLLESKVYVDTTKVKKLNLKELTLKELSKHPYISYKQSKQLYNLYRKNNKLNNEEVEDLTLFSKKDWSKLKPYIK